MKKSLGVLVFLLVVLGGAGLYFFQNQQVFSRISLDVLDLFPQNQERQMIDLLHQFGNSKYIVVSQNTPNADENFKNFLSEVLTLPNVEKIVNGENQAFKNFLARNYFYVGNFHPKKISEKEMVVELQRSFLEQNLNLFDPLGFISLPTFQKEFKVGDIPYVLVVMKSSEANAVDRLYQSFQALAKKYGIKHYYSPLFMSVENPQLILEEVNVLMGIATLCFVLLYFVILRIPMLTLNVIFAILFSNLVAVCTLLAIYPQVSIMSLSFGVGISNIGIDYMMHHHFLQFYSRGKMRFNVPVFYGFATTMIGFVVCLFVPFPLLNQLSLYAIVNLSMAYVIFAFLYQAVGFSPPRYYQIIGKLGFQRVYSVVFLFGAMIAGAFGLYQIKSDFDLQKLDYQNQEMNMQRDYFKKLYDNDSLFLVSAKNLDGLIAKAREINASVPEAFLPLALLPTNAEIKRRQRFFKSITYRNFQYSYKKALYEIQKQDPKLAGMLGSAYRGISSYQSSLTVETLRNFGFDIVEEKGRLYYQSTVPKDKLKNLAHFDGANLEQTEELFQKITDGIYAPMVSILCLAFVAMIVLLLISTRQFFFDALTFVLFPISMVLLYLSMFSNGINLMHLFAMLIVVVVSVDYGIYSTKEKDNLGARHAILFSTLTTLISFGILFFSQVRALSSFGEVICVGMLCILVLMFFQKNCIRHLAK